MTVVNPGCCHFEPQLTVLAAAFFVSFFLSNFICFEGPPCSLDHTTTTACPDFPHGPAGTQTGGGSGVRETQYFNDQSKCSQSAV